MIAASLQKAIEQRAVDVTRNALLDLNPEAQIYMLHQMRATGEKHLNAILDGVK
jgi:hypothetical protein